VSARRAAAAATLAVVPFAAGSALVLAGLLHVRVSGLIVAGIALAGLAVLGAVNAAALTPPRPLARITAALLPDDSVGHQSRYEIDPGALARLIGIEVPDGGQVSLAQKSTASRRMTALRPDRKLVVCVTWPGDKPE
jgi:hypothetical protein